MLCLQASMQILRLLFCWQCSLDIALFRFQQRSTLLRITLAVCSRNQANPSPKRLALHPPIASSVRVSREGAFGQPTCAVVALSEWWCSGRGLFSLFAFIRCCAGACCLSIVSIQHKRVRSVRRLSAEKEDEPVVLGETRDDCVLYSCCCKRIFLAAKLWNLPPIVGYENSTTSVPLAILCVCLCMFLIPTIEEKCHWIVGPSSVWTAYGKRHLRS